VVAALRTWDYVPCVHGILVLDEAKAIHELDLGDLSSSMLGEMSLNIGLAGCWGDA
jgi:hypothetical protein